MARLNFWIVKGNPRYPISGVEERCGDIGSFLSAGPSSDWITYRKVPPECREGDPVFFWSSGKLRSIIALGLMEKIHSDKQTFDIKHISKRMFPKEKQVDIQEIRSTFDRELSPDEYDQALYIKPSVVATIYLVTPDQAAVIIKLLCSKNPDSKHQKCLSGWMQRISRKKDLSGQSSRS